MLYELEKRTQGFIRDRGQVYLDPEDIVRYINQARREVAMRTQCIRRLTPISGQCTQIQITNPGSHYTNPTLVITPPDFPPGSAPTPGGAQATGTAQADALGHIINAQITYGGSGYFQPQASITDPTGTGAVLTVSTQPLSTTIQNQEVYPFSSIDMSIYPGIKSIFAIRSAAIIYSNLRYTLLRYSWSTYQAKIRQYPFQYSYVPAFASQFGQGAGGSLYTYPIANGPYQLELDALCLPADLTSDQDYEAIPDPWIDNIPYFAAHLAFLELQNLNSASYFLKLHDERVARYSAYARVGTASNVYGRWALPFMLAGAEMLQHFSGLFL